MRTDPDVGPSLPGRPLRVLQSFKKPRATTNPYLTQLVGAVEPTVEIAYFSWRTALFGRYDVLHIHWPELIFLRDGRLKSLLGALLFRLVLLRVRWGRVALVRTLHNVQPHEHRGLVIDALLRYCDRVTTLWIALNDGTVPQGPSAPGRRDAPVVVIPHGDYTAWFSRHPRSAPVPGRLLYFGLIRPYKGVEALIDAFSATTSSVLRLHITGKPNTTALADEVRSRAGSDPRITVQLEHVQDDDLVREVGESELVVLPYREMNNSGAMLLALSLDRPVLVPDNPITARLAAEVGEDWVLRYTDALTPPVLESAWAQARDRDRSVTPDLSARRWDLVAAAHIQAYERAAAIARGRAADADQAAEPTARRGREYSA